MDPGLIVRHAGSFSDTSLECKYREYLEHRYKPFCTAFLKYSGILSFCFVVFSEVRLHMFTVSEMEKKSERVNQISLAGTGSVALLSWIAIKMRTSNIEIIMFCCILTQAVCTIFGTGPDTYWLSENECFTSPSEGETIQVDTRRCGQVWILSVAVGAALSNFNLVLASYVGVLRRRTFKMVVVGINLIHAMRYLVLSPIPASAYGNWIGLLNVGIPGLYYYLGLTAEISKREMFLMQLRLMKDNAELNTKLMAAESALAFEAPTNDEKRVVTQVLKEEQGGVAHLRDLEIPFKDLKLCERIASGAFGEVIKAEYAGDTVAVKRLLRSQINETSIRMLVQEVGLLQDLHHANIVTLIGVSWDSVANICIILEYMARGSLLGILEDSQLRLSWQDPKLKMLTDIASGLAYLHSRPSPVIHRDVKPDNVLVTPTFGCKLTDFGASRKTEIDSTMTQIGTQSYMAPEVIKGARYDEKVDVYSLGILMVVMHTRKKPFPPSCLPGQSVIAFVLYGGRPEVPPDMPGGLAELAAACWQEEARDRPTSHRIVEMLMERGLRESSGVDCFALSTCTTTTTVPTVVGAPQPPAMGELGSMDGEILSVREEETPEKDGEVTAVVGGGGVKKKGQQGIGGARGGGAD